MREVEILGPDLDLLAVIGPDSGEYIESLHGGDPDAGPEIVSLLTAVKAAGESRLAYVLTRTSQRSLYGDVAGRVSGDSELVAVSCALHVGLTLPPGSSAIAGLIPRAMDYASRVAANVDQWPEVSVSIDGTLVRAKRWNFAGATTVVARHAEALLLSAFSRHLELSGLRFTSRRRLERLGVIDDQYASEWSNARRHTIIGDVNHLQPDELHPDFQQFGEHLAQRNCGQR